MAKSLHFLMRKLFKETFAKFGLLKPGLKNLDSLPADKLSSDELLAFMRHDAHRIEKAFYNKIFESKRSYYERRRANVYRAIETLSSRGCDLSDPTIVWAKEIADLFEELEDEFITKRSSSARPIDIEASRRFVDMVSRRRSSRVWSAVQPSSAELLELGHQMVRAGQWAPNSGNRQPLRFKIILSTDDKNVLKGLKEEHCYSAPCIIFIGTDVRFYGGLGRNEAAIHVDAGAAAMQMMLTAHTANMGVCWNHFTRDLIESRNINREIYKNFTDRMKISAYIEPVAILAFGCAEFYPPVPPRMRLADVLL